MICIETDELIEELFESLLKRCQNRLETALKGSGFIFDCFRLLCYKFHEIDINCGASCIDSPDWIINKKTTVNPVSDDDKCFQYAATAVLNHRKSEYIQKEYQKVSFYK